MMTPQEGDDVALHLGGTQARVLVVSVGTWKLFCWLSKKMWGFGGPFWFRFHSASGSR